MNWKSIFIAFVAAFAFIFIFDGVFHGLYMKSAWYEPYAQFWRPESEVPMHWMLIGQLLMADAIAFAVLISGKSGIKHGALMGVSIGTAFASLYLVFYAVQPFPCGMVAMWIIGAMVEAIIAGAIIGKIYKPLTA